MSKTLMTYVLALVAICFVVLCTKRALGEEIQSFILPEDTIVFRSDFNAMSAAKFTQQVFAHQGKVMTLFIDSPGGSVTALDSMISAVRATQKPVICVTSFAASAAYMLMQEVCTKRLVMPHSITMSHQAGLGLPQLEMRKLEGLFNFFKAMVGKLEESVAKRLGMSTDVYRTKIDNEWWTHGADIVATKQADRVTLFACTPEMAAATYQEEIQFFIFRFLVTYSKCPLISAPLAIQPIQRGTPAVPTDSQSRLRAFGDYYRSYGMGVPAQ